MKSLLIRALVAEVSRVIESHISNMALDRFYKNYGRFRLARQNVSQR
jgi:hypothetical protein